jgi:hypothetical protein
MTRAHLPLVTLLVLGLGAIGATSVEAQWRYRDPTAPRTATGAVDTKAPPPRTAAGIVDLSGIWQTDVKFNANLGADLRPGSIPMLPWGRALFDERQKTLGKDDPEGFCLPPGVPRAGGVPFPQKIIQLPTMVIVLYETRTTFRQIFLDGHTLPADPQPTWMGYSRGRWQGDTLVVDTTGFNGLTWLDDAGHPASEQMKVTERFRRPDFGHLFIDITIDDPKAYATPWTVTQEYQLTADGELIEYVCNENNLSLPHLVGQ